MDKIIFLLVFCFFSLGSLFSQSNPDKAKWNLYTKENVRILKPDSELIPSEGRVTFIQDREIVNLIDDYRSSDQHVRGYRVQIFFGEKKEAESFRLEFMKNFPETMAYLTYKTPNFKVRVGDFRTRLEAEAFRYRIREKFYDSYIVSDKINLF